MDLPEADALLTDREKREAHGLDADCVFVNGNSRRPKVSKNNGKNLRFFRIRLRKRRYRAFYFVSLVC